MPGKECPPQPLDRKEISRSGKFLIGLVAFFVLLNLLFSLIPLEWVEFVFAFLTSLIFSVFGAQNELVYGEPVIILLHNFPLPISISYLCTGLLELSIIVAAVAASFGIKIEKRIAGIIAATATIFAFNLTRIVLSIGIILLFGLEIGELSHEVLFRIFLFLVIAGFYFIWFNWATKGEQKN
ncbi:MAG: exosortase/archaeosortase family protein [Candidatus Diapherotrites archaeon]